VILLKAQKLKTAGIGPTRMPGKEMKYGALPEWWDMNQLIKKMSELDLPNLHIVFVRVPKWVDFIYKYGPLIYVAYLIWQYKAYKEARKIQRKLALI
jgi:hypothetical protein